MVLVRQPCDLDFKGKRKFGKWMWAMGEFIYLCVRGAASGPDADRRGRDAWLTTEEKTFRRVPIRIRRFNCRYQKCCFHGHPWLLRVPLSQEGDRGRRLNAAKNSLGYFQVGEALGGRCANDDAVMDLA
jgi:hypothetical protein